ncbi:ROK family transcriptional regulator [Paenarthrobacter ureafaciens]|uniref:ROK family transcriptional regulator n=1 Tax=Paenarthrobacter ureafaciens TaxID=37931 RepID=UPI002DBF4FDE|nr:ROK family protein [Paenarthrobacter ureafaciens]MEC3854108.1 ROK family protein [Paenarthrobacter ureafaciens]
MGMHVQGSGAPGNDSANSLVSGDVRRHNLGLVAGYLVTHGPGSRSQIADGTGLTRGAVTALSKVLVDAGIVREVQPVAGGGMGRPITLLELAGDDVALLVLQLDADRAIAVVASLAGDILFRFEEHHGRPMGDPEAVLNILAAVLDQAMTAAAEAGRRIADATVVVFAPVAGKPAKVIADTDLGWGMVDVLGQLRKRVPALPETARLCADVDVAAVAEYNRLQDVRDMLYLKSNSGVGGAIFVDGRLLEGTHGFAGAFGHVPVNHDGPECPCGQRGCLDMVAGPDVVLRSAGLGKELEEEGLTSALAELVTRIERGEELATAAWNRAAVWIARTLHILTMSLDPEVVMLGGYWAALVAPVREAFEAHRPFLALEPGYGPKVVAGELGDDAALVGAIRAARDRLLADPLALNIV